MPKPLIISSGWRLQRLAETVFGWEWARPVSDLTGVAVRTCQRTRKATLDGLDDPRASGVLAALQTALQSALDESQEGQGPLLSTVTGMRVGADALTRHAESYGHEYAPDGAGRCRHCGRPRDETDPRADPNHPGHSAFLEERAISREEVRTDQLALAVDALKLAQHGISAQYALAQAEYQHLDAAAAKHNKVVQNARRTIRETLAELQAGRDQS